MTCIYIDWSVRSNAMYIYYYLLNNVFVVYLQICSEHLSCEIDPTRLQDCENINTNLENLRHYIEQIFDAITNSGLICPTEMSQVFFTLKQIACKHYPGTTLVHYLFKLKL